MTGDVRVAVLARRGLTSYLLVNALAERFEVTGVVFDQGSRLRMLRRRARRLGLGPVLAQLLFLVWERLVHAPRSRRRIRELLEGRDVRPPDGRMPVLEVATVNDPMVGPVLAEWRPDVVVVSGTGIIGSALLSSGPPFINVHCGITPAYRGVHGAFWAVWEGRPELAGVTVHLVDEGIDTGGILRQEGVGLDARDTLRTLPVKQYLAALEPLCAAVAQLAGGRSQTYRRDELPSALWSSPTLRDHRRFRRQLRRHLEGGR